MKCKSDFEPLVNYEVFIQFLLFVRDDLNNPLKE